MTVYRRYFTAADGYERYEDFTRAEDAEQAVAERGGYAISTSVTEPRIRTFHSDRLGTVTIPDNDR